MIPGKGDGRLAWYQHPEKGYPPVGRWQPHSGEQMLHFLWVLGSILPAAGNLLTGGATLGKMVCGSPGSQDVHSPRVQQPTQPLCGRGCAASPRGGLHPHGGSSRPGSTRQALGGVSCGGSHPPRQGRAWRTCWVLEAGPCVCLRARCRIAAEPWVSCTWGWGQSHTAHKALWP